MAVDIYPILATICQKCEKFKARLNMLEQSMSGDIYHWLCHIVVVVIVVVVVMMVVVMVMVGCWWWRIGGGGGGDSLCKCGSYNS